MYREVAGLPRQTPKPRDNAADVQEAQGECSSVHSATVGDLSYKLSVVIMHLVTSAPFCYSLVGITFACPQASSNIFAKVAQLSHCVPLLKGKIAVLQ